MDPGSKGSSHYTDFIQAWKQFDEAPIRERDEQSWFGHKLVEWYWTTNEFNLSGPQFSNLQVEETKIEK